MNSRYDDSLLPTFLLVFSITKKKKVVRIGFGKKLITNCGTSPDATVQLIKQLAFHQMFGRPAVTYESAQTRKFQLGRTEVIRSASNESKAWAEAMLDPELVCPRLLKILGNSN
jgi:carnitine O-acetyltransferase